MKQRRGGGERKIHARWWKTYRRQIIIGVPVAVLVIMVVAQLAYSRDRLLPWQRIDEVAFGGDTKSDVVKRLNSAYAKQKTSLYFGKSKKAQYEFAPKDIGLTVSNKDRVQDMGYAWYLRLVPTSLFWGHKVIAPDTPKYTTDEKKVASYVQKNVGDSCEVAPINATAEVKGDAIVAVAEEDGGICKLDDVKKQLQSLKPVLTKESIVRVAMKESPAEYTKDKVEPLVKDMNERLKNGVSLTYDDKTLAVDKKTVLGWLAFSSDEGSLAVGFNESAATYVSEHLSEPLARAAGVSKVTTRDFVEVSRTDGQTGRQLNVDETLNNVRMFIQGEADATPVAETIVQPKVEYSRSYSNTDAGLSALMKNFAESNPGTYGVSLIELDGKRRRASFNDTQKFTTASTYKLYVAYSALKRAESGEMAWGDAISAGRNLEKCFDDMIVLSDNPCAEALVAKIGYRPLTTDAQSIVSGNTTFLDTESYKTTAGDLATFMASLATGQISLNGDSQARFLGALKRNVYRQGIPAGTSGAVADKVGFLDGLLHDAAIVYSPSGMYALAVMTDGSSWGKIAELTKEIEKVRG